MTPAERHSGVDRAILAQRKEVYEAAKERNPERWSRDTRNWTPAAEVWLNPANPEPDDVEIRDEAA